MRTSITSRIPAAISTEDIISCALQGICDSIILTDAAGVVIFMNEVAEKLTGYSNSDGRGQAIEAICSITDAGQIAFAKNPVHEVIATGQNLCFDNLLLTDLNGNSYNINVSIAPVCDKAHAIIGAVITIKDISEQLANLNKLKAAHLKIEEIHKGVKDSILYAKRIQEAMLPDPGLLSRNFEESFIIYKPKDIISGDFYWFAEAGNSFIIAVADCTGHGVPGALMSTIGCSFLNEIVNNKKITTPGQILTRLDLCLKQVLRTDLTGSHCHDGMDIAVCCIDKTRGTLEYAGAGRPVYCIQNGQLSVITGDKYGLGGAVQGPKRVFTNHLKLFNSGDVLYLFSDGYSDQFGGRKEKKMMTRNFMKLLDATVSYGIAEQEKMLNQWLDRWKGKLEQTDDILLVGMKL